MTKLITLDEMRAALRRAVDERGEDWVYPLNDPYWNLNSEPGRCLYRLDDGSPACIIGLAMSYLLPSVRLAEGKSAQKVLTSYCEKRAVRYADIAQQRQDNGDSWGQALTCADNYL